MMRVLRTSKLNYTQINNFRGEIWPPRYAFILRTSSVQQTVHILTHNYRLQCVRSIRKLRFTA